MARPPRDDDDVDRELATDLELEAEELRERGVSAREAEDAARRALGNRALIKEEIHDMSPWSRFEALAQDVRYGLRMLRRAPAFTTISIVTLALGVGACTAIFSVVDAVLLRPLPYKDPTRLVTVWTELRARNVLDFPFPIPDVKDLRTDAKTLDGVAGLFPPGRATIGGGVGQPEQARVLAATPNLLSLLGARVELGREFTEADGTPQTPPPPAAPGAAPAPAPRPLPVIAVLTHEFWQRKFGGDPSVVGTMIDFNAGRAQVIGVLAPGFQLLMPPRTGIDPAVDMVTALRLNFDTANHQGQLEGRQLVQKRTQRLRFADKCKTESRGIDKAGHTRRDARIDLEEIGGRGLGTRSRGGGPALARSLRGDIRLRKRTLALQRDELDRVSGDQGVQQVFRDLALAEDLRDQLAIRTGAGVGGKSKALVGIDLDAGGLGLFAHLFHKGGDVEKRVRGLGRNRGGAQMLGGRTAPLELLAHVGEGKFGAVQIRLDGRLAFGAGDRLGRQQRIELRAFLRKRRGAFPRGGAAIVDPPTRAGGRKAQRDDGGIKNRV